MQCAKDLEELGRAGVHLLHAAISSPYRDGVLLFGAAVGRYDDHQDERFAASRHVKSDNDIARTRKSKAPRSSDFSCSRNVTTSALAAIDDVPMFRSTKPNEAGYHDMESYEG